MGGVDDNNDDAVTVLGFRISWPMKRLYYEHLGARMRSNTKPSTMLWSPDGL